MPHGPRFYKNTLTTPEITQELLQETLVNLQTAVHDGVQLIESKHPAGEDDGRGIFSGDLGIALAYLRLAHQSPSLTPPNHNARSPPEFHSLADSRIPSAPSSHNLAIGLLSPLASQSPLSSATLRILHHLSSGTARDILDADLVVLRNAVKMALEHGATGMYHGHELGADEVLFGRAGLLWTLLNIRQWEVEGKDVFDPKQKGLLAGALGDEIVGRLIEVIVRAGQQGGAECQRILGEKGQSLLGDRDSQVMPLMWVWKKGYYGLGWAHGLTGILSILLSTPTKFVTPHLTSIAATIKVLCNTCIAENGHLPTCIPPRSSPPHLVQICHGAPAFLSLMACALRVPELIQTHWTPEWDTAIHLATQRVWEEGLLVKGGGLCHGIAGNAWAFLMLYLSFEENAGVLEEVRRKYSAPTGDVHVNADVESGTGGPLTPDFFLSRALAMLLHARETQPYNTAPERASKEYRMPDHPYSLFEGLAGTLCAWAEASVVLRGRLRKLELEQTGLDVNADPVVRECRKQELGFPFLGGKGVTGLL
ncbi:hypothetical protein BJX68DRAFT_243937 [Aspergillus pseudodeflectus]|uniref:Lanthionine synthetase C family protein n=1 Tax=Aspergillus pseudodeflectus TaxID=176178 RepID=A0ABR4JTS3_9EURO